MNKVIHGDCLIESEQIASGSVDLILTDPPFGTVNGIGGNGDINHGMKGKTEWDMPIEPKDLYSVANRTLRKNGKMVLFAQEPYTNLLINEAIPNLPFCYRMMWEKDHFANSLIAKKAPVSYYEDILVFSKDQSITGKHPLRDTMLDYVEEYGKENIIGLFRNEGRYTSELSARVHASYKFGFNDGMRFDLMDENLYRYCSKHIKFKQEYAELKRVDNEYNQKFASTFNLWEGKKYKSNILKYAKDYDGYHPTQKPVALLEDLIKTFSNEGDLVVDLTAGSGSTAVACNNTGRNYIMIEQEQKYIDIINKRIAEHEQQQTIFEGGCR